MNTYVNVFENELCLLALWNFQNRPQSNILCRLRIINFSATDCLIKKTQLRSRIQKIKTKLWASTASVIWQQFQ